MEMELKFVRRLSLKEMALRRLTAALWCGSDILASIWKFQYYSAWKNCEEKWLEIFEPEIRDRVLKLNLPESLTEQMLEIARPIGLQIKWWKDLQEYHLRFKKQNISLPDAAKLCWTNLGTIDYRRTAEELVRCDKLDVELRYLLACVNCLEDDIPLLWEKLPEEKKNFYSEGWYKMAQSTFLPFWWPHIIKSHPSKLEFMFPKSDTILGFNQWMFEKAVRDYNKTATEFFVEKYEYNFIFDNIITMLSVRKNLAFLQKGKSEVVFYLLSLMNSTQQVNIFRWRPIGVLFLFLHWPRTDLFLENALLFWKVFPHSEYEYLLRAMYSRLKNSDLYFPKLFPEFFKLSPVDFKKYFVGRDESFAIHYACLFLEFFLEFEDLESIKAIFSSIDAEDRAELVLNHRVLHLFRQFILKDKLHMVKACLQETMLSEGHRMRVREFFTKIRDTFVRGESEKTKLGGILEFLDGGIAEKKGTKRKLEEC